MKILILLLSALCFASCGLFCATPTRRLAIDTSVVLYRNYEGKTGSDSSIYTYLPKHYKVTVSDGPDFSVLYFTFESRDSADGYIGFAGEYEGMAAQRTQADPDETFVEQISDTLKDGDVSKWDIYRSAGGWSMKTSERLNEWAYGPTRQSLRIWREILKTWEVGP